MFGGLNDRRKGHEEDMKVLMEQSLRTAGVLAAAVLIFFGLYLVVLFF